jgi:toxin ParE1/3/4
LRVILSPQAVVDLERQCTYLAEHAGTGVAERFVAAAEAALQEVAAMPAIGAPQFLPNSRLSGLRKWAIPGFESYLIFYRGTSDLIRVLRVLHAARDIESIFESEPDE